MSNIDEKYRQFTQRQEAIKPSRVDRASQAAAAVAEMDVNKPLYVVKQMKANGMLYQKGDIFPYDSRRDVIASLVKHGYIVPAEEWENAKARDGLKPKQAQVESHYARILSVRTELVKAEKEQADLQGRLANAKAEVKRLIAALESLENALLPLLG